MKMSSTTSMIDLFLFNHWQIDLCEPVSLLNVDCGMISIGGKSHNVSSALN